MQTSVLCSYLPARVLFSPVHTNDILCMRSTSVSIVLLKFNFKIRCTANIKQQMAVALMVFCLMQNEGKDCQALNEPRTELTDNAETKK